MVARRKVAHRVTHRVDHAGPFVAIDRRIRAAEITVAAVQVGLAHAARHDTNDQLVRPRRGELERVDDERG